MSAKASESRVTARAPRPWLGGSQPSQFLTGTRRILFLGQNTKIPYYTGTQTELDASKQQASKEASQPR